VERGCVRNTSRSRWAGREPVDSSSPFSAFGPLRLGRCPQPRSFSCGCAALRSIGATRLRTGSTEAVLSRAAVPVVRAGVPLARDSGARRPGGSRDACTTYDNV